MTRNGRKIAINISYKCWETVPSSKYEPEEEAFSMFEAAEAEAKLCACRKLIFETGS